MKKIFMLVLVFLASFLTPNVLFSKERERIYDFKPIYIVVEDKSPKNSSKKPTKTKFYNFDDLLINGQYKKPQVLYTDAKQKVKFERLLKLKKDFLPKLKNTDKDPTLK